MVSQPYVYQRRELAEPDWHRFPGWAGVSAADWESAQWQRAHSVKNDPIHMLSEPGQAWWRAQGSRPPSGTAEVVSIIANATG